MSGNQGLVLLERSEKNEHVAILTLNRPDARNALNTPMLKEFEVRLDEINKDTDIRVVIMQPNGKHASVGADLNELVEESDDGYKNRSEREIKKHLDDGRLVAQKIFTLRPPIIAIAWGFCLGGGAEMYTSCDVFYGASGGKEESGMMYGFPEPTIGVMAGWMGPEFLVKRIGRGDARDLLFSGRLIPADEALRMGIIQAVYPKDELMPAAMKWALKVAENGPLAVEATKRVVNDIIFPSLPAIVHSTWTESAETMASNDFAKGATKILTGSKKQPEYERN